jgi:galactosylceramidase
LQDYNEPQRSQILDYLFKPNFGASLDIIKVEIGGDCQSTSGTEASHMHSRHDLGCGRGYEGWLLAEARKRNPKILTWGLSWGVPHWIGEGPFALDAAASTAPTSTSSAPAYYFSQDNIGYQTQWLKCINDTIGIEVDFMGIWNERPYGPMSYTIALREAFDRAGFHNTKIVLPDGAGIGQTLVDQLNTNASFSQAVYAVGQHGSKIDWTGKTFKQKYWCTESEVSNGWPAAKSWGPTLNQNFIGTNQTSTTSWSLLWSVPEALSPYQNRGAMMASTPWSGYYYVDPTIWMHAHWTQVTEVGWTILGVATGGSGYFDGGWQNGTFVSIVSPDKQDFSIVLERLHARTAVNVTLQLVNLPTKPLVLWKTNALEYFQRDTSQTVLAPNSSGEVTLCLDSESM